MDNFKTRVIAAQTALKAPKNQRNSFGGYNYRSCEDILEAAKPICAAQHLLLNLRDDIVLVGERYYIKAEATLTDTESAESVTVTAFARESHDKKGMDDSQITGTASSYARKYALNGLFCIDDSKDADTDEYAQNAKKPTQATDKQDGYDGELVCSECHSPIKPWIKNGKLIMNAVDFAANSQREFGKPLCLACVKKRNAD